MNSMMVEAMIEMETKARTEVPLYAETMQPTLVNDLLVVPHLLPHLGLGVPLLLSLLHHVSEDAELLLADVPTGDFLSNHLDSAVTEIFELDLPQ